MIHSKISDKLGLRLPPTVMSCGMQLFHLALHPPLSDRPFA